jgi:hypothetical protein
MRTIICKLVEKTMLYVQNSYLGLILLWHSSQEESENSSREEKGKESTRKGVTENKPSPLKNCVGEDKEKTVTKTKP